MCETMQESLLSCLGRCKRAADTLGIARWFARHILISKSHL